MYRALNQLEPLIQRPIEKRAPEQVFPIPVITPTGHRPKSKQEGDEFCKAHEDWRTRLPDNTFMVYTDGSQSTERHNGAGWYVQLKSNDRWVTKHSGSCYLGRNTEVIDNEAHAVCEALALLFKQPALPL
jgi:hypothetical protein